MSQFPGVTLADVYAALSYYHDHLSEISAEIRKEQELAQAYEDEFGKDSILQRKLAETKRVS